MTAILLPEGKQSYTDAAGVPLVGGKLWTTQQGTGGGPAGVAKTTWSDAAQTAPNTNPIILDARGEASIYWDGAYTVQLRDALDNVIWTALTASTVPSFNSSMIPGTDNLYDIGSPAFAWRQQYLGAQHAPVLNTATGNVGYFRRTDAEITAAVVPVDFGAPPTVEIAGQRYGFTGDDATNNDAAWAAARAVLVVLGGGVLRLAPGIYRFATQISLPPNSSIEGCGQAATTLKCTAAITAILISSTTARTGLRALTLQGNAKTGTGLQVGDADFTGVHGFRDLYIQGFAVGIRLAAALWTSFDNVYVTLNTVGIDFNAGGVAKYSTTVSFWKCVIDNNDLQGVKASFVPVTNSVIGFYHCTVQENCKTNTALPQMRFGDGTGAVRGLVLDNIYGESATVGIDFCDLALVNGFRITNSYVNGAKDVFKDSVGGSCSQGLIALTQAVGITGKFINIASGADVCELMNSFAGSITLTGTGCRTLSGNGIASWQGLTVAFAPTIKGAGVAGAPTYTLQSGVYSKVGNIVFFEVRVTISAKGGMTGGISIEGLPLANLTLAGVPAVFAAHMDGVTVSGGNTAFHVELPSGSTSLQLFQSGSTAAAQIIDTALAAATTIIVSGCYQTAT